jgi:hypothetical protein
MGNPTDNWNDIISSLINMTDEEVVTESNLDAIASNILYLYKRGGVVELTNSSGLTLSAGAVVVSNPAVDFGATLTTSARHPSVLGVVADGPWINGSTTMRVQTVGICQVIVNAATVRGQYLSHSFTAGQAQPSLIPGDGDFAIALSNQATPGQAVYALLIPTRVHASTIALINRSGSSSGYGWVAVADTANDFSWKISATPRDTRVVGVVVEGAIANGQYTRIQTTGIVDVYCTNTAARGDFLSQSSATAQAQASSTPGDGDFAIALEAGGGGNRIKALIVPLRKPTVQTPEVGSRAGTNTGSGAHSGGSYSAYLTVSVTLPSLPVGGTGWNLFAWASGVFSSTGSFPQIGLQIAGTNFDGPISPSVSQTNLSYTAVVSNLTPNATYSCSLLVKVSSGTASWLSSARVTVLATPVFS